MRKTQEVRASPAPTNSRTTQEHSQEWLCNKRRGRPKAAPTTRRCGHWGRLLGLGLERNCEYPRLPRARRGLRRRRLRGLRGGGLGLGAARVGLGRRRLWLVAIDRGGRLWR